MDSAMSRIRNVLDAQRVLYLTLKMYWESVLVFFDYAPPLDKLIAFELDGSTPYPDDGNEPIIPLPFMVPQYLTLDGPMPSSVGAELDILRSLSLQVFHENVVEAVHILRDAPRLEDVNISFCNDNTPFPDLPEVASNIRKLVMNVSNPRPQYAERYQRGSSLSLYARFMAALTLPSLTDLKIDCNKKLSQYVVDRLRGLLFRSQCALTSFAVGKIGDHELIPILHYLPTLENLETYFSLSPKIIDLLNCAPDIAQRAEQEDLGSDEDEDEADEYPRLLPKLKTLTMHWNNPVSQLQGTVPMLLSSLTLFLPVTELPPDIVEALERLEDHGLFVLVHLEDDGSIDLDDESRMEE
jgi:hypothetical protein